MPAVTIPMASNRAMAAPATMIPALARTPRGGAGKNQVVVWSDAPSSDCPADVASSGGIEGGLGMSIDDPE